MYVHTLVVVMAPLLSGVFTIGDIMCDDGPGLVVVLFGSPIVTAPVIDVCDLTSVLFVPFVEELLILDCP